MANSLTQIRQNFPQKLYPRFQVSYLALASDDTNSVFLGQLICLEDLDPRAKFEGRAAIRARSIVFVEYSVLEMVGPDAESSLADGLAAEIMTGVLDNQAQ